MSNVTFMSEYHQTFVPSKSDHAKTMTDRLHNIHRRILSASPNVDRIACATYDANEDLLSTLINSTLSGKALSGYSTKLSSSASLSRIAQTGESRIIDEITNTVKTNSLHSKWLLEQGYHSSLTIPMYDNGLFIGFIFFDSLQPNVFTPNVLRDLELYTNLITMLITNELAAVRTISASVRVAKKFTLLRDFETGMHLERMARYSRVIAKAVAPIYELSDELVEHIFLFAPLHDVGKIGIPDNLLLKPEKFNTEERKEMESHVVKGVELIKTILGEYSLSHLPDSIILMNIVHAHHEYLDGSGYPRGLKGDEIPIEARIITVADIFDALTSVRPYKKIWAIATAVDELQQMADAGKVDTHCVNALIAHLDEMIDINNHYQDEYLTDSLSA